MFTRKRCAFTFIYVSFIFFSILAFRIIRVSGEVDKVINKVEKQSYLDKYDLSLIDYDKIDETLDEIEKDVLDKKITFNIGNNKSDFTLKEIGVELNKESIKKEILDYENSVEYYDRYSNYSRDSYSTKNYELKYVLDEDNLKEFLNNVKEKFDKKPVKGKLVMDKETRELSYKDEVVGYSLNIDKSLEIVKNSIGDKDYKNTINLDGKELREDDPNRLINYKLSSFSSKFNAKESRKFNLAHAASSIDGVVVMPGAVFSYYKYAGPYNGAGYIYYHGVKGNGVCQVASTLYDAELLAGLQTVTRYAHPDMPLYVKGGLDTAVSTSPTFNADFKFKNNKSTPIYISAFIKGDTLTVEIWGNENANNGVKYEIQSVKKAYASYDAYRFGYKDGQKVSSEYLGHSWYKTEATSLY